MLLAAPLTAASAGLVGPWERTFEVERTSGQGSDAVSAPSRPCASDEANCILASFQVLLFTSAVRGTQITHWQGSGVDLARHIPA